MATDAYPLLEEPLPAHQVTLAGYADQIGVGEHHIHSYWMPRERFPEPVGQLPGRGRNGGGRPRKVYLAKDLDDFRAGEPDLWPRKVTRIVTELDPAEWVTIGFFAAHSRWETGGRPDRTTITQYQGAPGFPPGRKAPGARALKYRAGDLAAYLNARPGRRGPNRPKGGQGSGTRGSGAPRRARARAA